VTVPVLVIDDNEGFLRVLRAVFSSPGSPFVVHTVETGGDALEFLGRQRPAFIVLDFRLPDMNAPAVLAQLSRDADLRTIPVLVLSQAGWEGEAVTASAAGATLFRTKPSGIEALRDLVIDFWKEHAHGDVDSPDRR
jgi:CheY-like chemotaxis protein